MLTGTHKLCLALLILVILLALPANAGAEQAQAALTVRVWHVSPWGYVRPMEATIWLSTCDGDQCMPAQPRATRGGEMTIKFPAKTYVTWSVHPPYGYRSCGTGWNTGYGALAPGESIYDVCFFGYCDPKGWF